jgi:hypothetical protein
LTASALTGSALTGIALTGIAVHRHPAPNPLIPTVRARVERNIRTYYKAEKEIIRRTCFYATSNMDNGTKPDSDTPIIVGYWQCISAEK